MSVYCLKGLNLQTYQLHNDGTPTPQKLQGGLSTAGLGFWGLELQPRPRTSHRPAPSTTAKTLVASYIWAPYIRHSQCLQLCLLVCCSCDLTVLGHFSLPTTATMTRTTTRTTTTTSAETATATILVCRMPDFQVAVARGDTVSSTGLGAWLLSSGPKSVNF